MYNQAASGSMDAFLTMMASARRQNQEENLQTCNLVEAPFDCIQKDLSAIRIHVQAAATIPAFCLSSSVPRTDDSNVIAKLVDRPKTLDVVWKEYVSGINGTKPASEYTQEDIRANATKHCRRNAFWQVVSGWVRAGKTPEQAINKIYSVYGHKNQTQKS